MTVKLTVVYGTPENPDAFVPLPAQPGDCASRIEHRLPAHLHGARDIRADDVVGPMELGRHSLVVIWKAEAQRAQAVPCEQPAEASVAAGIRIPLR